MAEHPSNLPSKTEMVPSIFNQLLLQLDHRGKWHLYLLSFQLYCTVILMKRSTVFLKTLKTAYRSIPWLCAICILIASAVAGAQSKHLLVLSTISSNMPQNLYHQIHRDVQKTTKERETSSASRRALLGKVFTKHPTILSAAALCQLGATSASIQYIVLYVWYVYYIYHISYINIWIYIWKYSIWVKPGSKFQNIGLINVKKIS